MKWFAERFSGWLVRIDAEKRPEPYRWCLPLSDNGEFVGVSTKSLNVMVVRTAREAGRELLDGRETYWRHYPTQEKIMDDQIDCKMVFTVTQGGKPFFNSEMNWANTGYTGMHDLEKALCTALLGLGEAARVAPAPTE